MVLEQQLLEHIRPGSSNIHRQFGDVKVAVELEASNQSGMLVRNIRLYGGTPEASPSVLKKRAEAVIDRLTRFNSNLRLMEWDRISNILRIRFRPEKADDGPVQFFEIIIDREPLITLHRLWADATIPFHVSSECFARLIDELVRIVHQERQQR